ncbi:Aste57867_15039 [Aphanomyces stellatus]|uniref:Aste57867_12548 protein n=1 Tax=Aphanomyces stellatus TaxID=120398 RepID=A0A485L332_9STRA|nr:hypothetical protein As57867_014982 [Aphanomyces stellatus]KAF0694069.1 hypothetical protein As57867_014983 [Aphanomyces stellatus]KAF0696721.1 hypothetical protein As57867_012502 [Aphanomyces stellatus]VFT89399.1 Aste57867_12548 [Aphanomyces stellatus]VFT91852.1 Aste57867_15038 [Aphanomyces stellatus]
MTATPIALPQKPTETIDMLYAKWNGAYAETFTNTANNLVTIQAATELHRHMQLTTATSVLEVAAGGGIGSQDILRYLEPSSVKRFNITDFSPAMVELAKQRIQPAAYDFAVDIAVANGQDLVDVEDLSVDRYIASFVLQMTPDPAAMLRESYRVLADGGLAGFVIWGRPEQSGWFSITHSIDPDAVRNYNNFYLGQDIPALRQLMLETIGFKSVVVWTSMCVTETTSAAAHADRVTRSHPMEDKALEAVRRERLVQASQAWLDAGKPIGLETYLIIATK